WIGWRHGMAVMIFFGFLSAFGQRVAFNIAIVAMVNQTDESAINNQTSANECPYAYQTGKFNWDPSTSDLLLGAMFYGYVVTQFPGGYLAERIGGCFVFGWVVMLSGVITILTPFIAEWNLNMFIASRVLLGLIQGPICAANHAILSKWAPVMERSFLFNLASSGGTIASFVFFILSGYLADSNFLGGWPSPLYITGISVCIWFIFWVFLSSESPSTHRFISQRERDYINNSIHSVASIESGKYVPPPWKSIFTSTVVWSQIFELFCEGIGFYIVFSVVPVYLSTVLHYRISEDGAISAYPYIGMFFVQLLASPIADYIRHRGWLSTTAVRKLFAILGGLMAHFVGCNHMAAVSLIIVGSTMHGLSASGCIVSFLDYAPRYAGLLMGLCNPWGNIGGFLSPLFANLITNGKSSQKKWNDVFFMGAGVVLAGPIVFAIFGSSEKQPWSDGYITEDTRPIIVVVDEEISESSDESLHNLNLDYNHSQ
ncbi:hypothetical protein CAPTEDRAFT_139448, partial [Capitella teleta]